MASVSERHAGGRPRVRQPSKLYVRVETLAKRRGLNIDDLAGAAGIGRSTLYGLHDPRLSTAQAIAAALGITVDKLLTDELPKKRGRSA